MSKNSDKKHKNELDSLLQGKNVVYDGQTIKLKDELKALQNLKNYLTKNTKKHTLNVQPYTKGVANARKK